MSLVSRLLSISGLAALAISSPVQARQADRTSELYHIFDIRTDLDRNTIVRSFTDALNLNTTDSQTITPLVRGEPPEKAASFELVDPLADSRLSALGSLMGSAQAAQLKQVKCDGAVWIGNAQRNLRGSQHLRLTMCLFPYTEGYHLDVYGLDTEDRGGGIDRKLGRLMAGAVVGKPGNWTNKTIVDLLREVRTKLGAQVSYVEGQPAFEGEPWNDAYQLMPSDKERADR